MVESNNKIQLIFSFVSYILSGCFIFSPLHKSQNILLSLISAFITGSILLYLILCIYGKKSISRPTGIFYIFLTSTASLISTFFSLMLITEVIKDTAYVAARDVSFIYYILLSLATAFVGAYLCLGKSKGILRFTVLYFFSFIFTLSISFCAFITTRHIHTIPLTNIFTPSISSIKTGVTAGVFFTADSSIYLYCMQHYFAGKGGKFQKKQIYAAYITAFIVISAYNLLTACIFGSNLMQTIKDPDYALVKLIPGIDFTELISFIRIVSYLIKSAVYIHTASMCLSVVFKNPSRAKKALVYSSYALIPLTVILLSVFDSTLEYGAFQHLMTPVAIIMSALFTAIKIIYQKDT